ncbi:hypothetical protein [Legionella gresilensis]|uniref:hypothetical protein n=1 Tax=Legionella gresilensis TaxID=91823 RepID=UPI001040F04C|nr:hypothetical protein [Legionella gresilensis]
MAKSASKKEDIINKKLLNLLALSFVKNNDLTKKRDALVELCLACAERRFCPFGNNKYSFDTQSMNWLIKRMGDDLELLKSLDIKNPEELTEIRQDIILGKNAEIACNNAKFKESYQKQNQLEENIDSTNQVYTTRAYKTT